MTVDEGDTLRITPSAVDPDGPAPITWRLVTGPEGMTIDRDTGEIIWTAPNGPETLSVVIAARDGARAEATEQLDITVANVPPSITLSGSAATRVNESYAINFDITDPGMDVVSRIEIDWGDGSAPTVLEGTATRASHVYSAIGSRDLRVTVMDETGSYVSDPFTVNVMPQTSLGTLVRVTGLEATEESVDVSFNLPIDAGSVGEGSVIVRDEVGARIAGGVVVAEDARSLTFQADVVMPAGDYTLRLLGGPNGDDTPGTDVIISADGGAAMDGDDDGVAGGDAVLDFRIAAGPTRPVANPVEVETPEGKAVVIDVLANDLPGDAGPLSPVISAPPQRGVIEVNADGTITYRPAENFVGDETFGYVVSDGTLVSDLATVTVRVLSGGGAPPAEPDPDDPDPVPAPDPGTDPAAGPPARPGPGLVDLPRSAPEGAPDVLPAFARPVSSAFSVGTASSRPTAGGVAGRGLAHVDQMLRCEALFSAMVQGLQVSLPARAPVGDTVRLELAERTPEALGQLTGWEIDWGDGTMSHGHADTPPKHQYQSDGVFKVRVTLLTEEGIFSTRLAIQVGTTVAFDITGIHRSEGAIELTFKRPIDGNDLDLAIPLPGVTLVDQDGRVIAGSARFADTATRLIFTPDAGDLPPGVYRMFLNAPVEDMAELLICTGPNGGLDVPGGSFVIQFQIPDARNAHTDATAGQAINIENAGGLTELLLRLALPAGLVGDATPGHDLPPEARLDVEPTGEGLQIAMTSTVPLPDGVLELARLHVAPADGGPVFNAGAGVQITGAHAVTDTAGPAPDTSQGPDAASNGGGADTVDDDRTAGAAPGLSFDDTAPLAMFALAAVRPGRPDHDWREGFLSRNRSTGPKTDTEGTGPNEGYRLEDT